jgi:AmiR/NasT family two-component response regulator
MEKTVLYQITPDDLRTFFAEEFEKKDMDAARNTLLKRCENIFVGVSEVANMHDVSSQTVRNYIADGLIKPELRAIEGGKYQFRLSYALTLDFGELKKRLERRKHEIMNPQKQ